MSGSINGLVTNANRWSKSLERIVSSLSRGCPQLHLWRANELSIDATSSAMARRSATTSPPWSSAKRERTCAPSRPGAVRTPPFTQADERPNESQRAPSKLRSSGTGPAMSRVLCVRTPVKLPTVCRLLCLGLLQWDSGGVLACRNRHDESLLQQPDSISTSSSFRLHPSHCEEPPSTPTRASYCAP